MKIMKKQSIYALMSAIALSGAIGFSSCSSDEKVTATPNPGYNQTEGTVPVQFLFNVGSYGGGASTRQDADATQAYNKLPTGKFRGIEGTRILCFQQATNGNYVPSCLVSGGSINNEADHIKATQLFDMARVLEAGSIGYSNETDHNSTRVLEMTFPLGTNSMVFYGKAITTESTHSKDIYGHLDDYHVEEDMTKVSFTLGKRLSDNSRTEFLHIQNLLAGILTCVMETNRGTSKVLATDVPETGVKPYGYNIEISDAANLKWRDYYIKYKFVGDPNPPAKPVSPVDGVTVMTQLEIKLARAYMEMTTIQNAELRNGSGPALLSTIKQLWGIVNSVRCAQPTSLPEAVAKYMAQRIHVELERYFEATFGTAKIEGLAPSAVSFKNTSESLVPNIKTDTYWPGGTFDESSVSGITSANNSLNTYPASFDLPQGSTHIKFCTLATGETSARENAGIPDGTPQYGFYYVQNYNSSAVGNNKFTVDDYYYPAELLYFGNSPIRVSDKEHKVIEYPQYTEAWNSEGSWPSSSEDPNAKLWTSNGSVSSSTRSVAMTNNINYGTALLEMTVGYGATTLYDNNHEIQERDYQTNEQDNTITPTASSFKLVGVIIGGQSPRIGWNMLPALQGSERQGYIFDDQISITSIPVDVNSHSDPNYTMVFDNYNAALADDAQEMVYIALEFQNNSGVDFFGKDNMIANGSNFYLIGKLDPSGKMAPDLPAYHALPPYGMTGDKTIPRVFIQDHKTMVNFKIGENSLKSAYLTVPDLRSSSVTLGLSVDMSWSQGLNYTGENSVILGN